MDKNSMQLIIAGTGSEVQQFYRAMIIKVNWIGIYSESDSDDNKDNF